MSSVNEPTTRFVSSTEGASALQSLRDEYGLGDADARHVLVAVVETAQDAPVPSPAAGDVLSGALGGAFAVAAGRIVSERTGMNPQMAQSLVALAMPYLSRYQHQCAGPPGLAPRPGPASPQDVAWTYPRFDEQSPRAPSDAESKGR